MFSRLIYVGINIINMKGSTGLKNNCLRFTKMASLNSLSKESLNSRFSTY